MSTCSNNLQNEDLPYQSRQQPHSPRRSGPSSSVKAKAGGLPKDLFGLDLDEDTIARCANQFEQDRKRWEAASFEEWCAGIDEIAVKFTNILDMVRTI